MRTQDTASMVASDPGYAPLKERLIAASGLDFYRDRDQDLTDLIAGRLAELGLDDCLAYLDLMADGSDGRAEFEALVSRLTVGETYFFRDRPQFDALRDIIFPEVLERKRASKQLRIWSAGCSTGAEPYSLAILLACEMAQSIAGWQISILATDINRQFLAQAAEGRFQEWAFRSTSPEVREQCFSREGSIWKIHPEYKQWIEFAHFNLVDQDFPSLHHETGDFDLILCRNVMIYFAAETTRRLILRFYASLASHGWFLVGAAEPNLESFTAFQLVNATGTTLYQKSAAKTHAGKASDCLAAPVPLPRAVVHPRAPAPGKVSDAAAHPPSNPELLAQDELKPSVYFYRALLQEQLGNAAEAERLLRQAIYLDRRFAPAHYHLGLCLKNKNRHAQARRSFENVLRLLSGRADTPGVLHGESTTPARLVALARRHLADLDAA